MASASTQVAASIGLSKTDATVEATLEYVRKGYLYKKVTKSLCFYLLHFRLISGGSVLLAIVLCFFLGQQEMTCYIIQPFCGVPGV
jgi:hypothetical protein